MKQLYPLRFRPLLKQYIWGGRRLGAVLGKLLGEGENYAESWEVSDHEHGQSVVENGPLAGQTLGTLAREHADELYGRHGAQPRFPLLFKYLDCQRVLSVQVHPDDAAAAKLSPPDLGKTEAWLILDAAPGAYAFAGLKRGFDRPAVERELQRGTLELCLNRLELQPDDCLLIRPGVIHALGPGFLVAEIQQASDVTYRLFDFNRLGADGKPRPLHIEQGLAVSDFSAGPQTPAPPGLTADPRCQRLAACEKFVFDRWRLDAGETAKIGGDERFYILSVTRGSITLSPDLPGGSSLILGQTVLVPSGWGAVEFTSHETSEVLQMYLP